MIEQPTDAARPNIVVIGGGFGGLTFCQSMKRTHAEILLIDKQNHHLFQPLLYQVAMAALAATEVAAPLRQVFAKRKDITVIMDSVSAIDPENHDVVMDNQRLHYDYLVLAAGGRTTYFGNDQWQEHAPGLKSLNDALRMRREILCAFERAETSLNTSEQEKLMTIVVVGGGPTGVELAGSMAEMVQRTFRADFRRIDPRNTRVILIDSGDRLLKAYPEDLSASAKRQLESLGVTVRLNTRVSNVDENGVDLNDGTRIDAANVLWGAGLVATELTDSLDAPKDRGGRLQVLPDLSVPGYPDIFAIGDCVTLRDKDGQEVPGVAPAAMQMGKHVAKIIHHQLRHGSKPPEDRPAFDYWDKGIMATIGRKRAVAWIGKLHISGVLAWLAWLGVHLVFLVSFRNKLVVLIQWFFHYLTFSRGARIIIPDENQAEAAQLRREHQPTPEPAPAE